MGDKTKILLGLLTTVLSAILVTAFSPVGDKLKDFIFSHKAPHTTIVSVKDNNGTLLTNGTSSFSTQITLTFGVKDNEQVSGYECNDSGEAFSPCTSPKTYKSLEPGSHIFNVRAINQAGDRDSNYPKYMVHIVGSASIMGSVKKFNSPINDIKVSVDDKFTGKVGSEGNFVVRNVPEGDRWICVKTLNNELLATLPVSIQASDNDKRIDIGVMSVSNAQPIPSSNSASSTCTISITSQMQSAYPIYLNHTATVLKRPNVNLNGVWTNGTWSVKVWVEGESQILSQIDRVTYFLHPTFHPPVVTRYSLSDKFGIYLTAWGQFEIKAKAYFKDGGVKDLSRELGFPL